MFSRDETRKTRTTCKISTFLEDLSFLNPTSYLKESLRLCDIWRIWNSKSKTFTPKHLLFGNAISLEFLQRRLDYLFVSSNIQEPAKNARILNALSINHFLLLCSFLNLSNISSSHGLWKFNHSLIWNTNFVDEMKILYSKSYFQSWKWHLLLIRKSGSY